MVRKKNNNGKYIFVGILILSDALSISLAFYTSYLLRNQGIIRAFLDSIQPIDVYIRALPFAIVLLIILFAIKGLYYPKARLTPVSEMYASVQTISLWILLIMAGSYLSKYDYSRIIIILLFFFSVLYNVLLRYLIRISKQYVFPEGFGKTRVVIVGTGKMAHEIEKRLRPYIPVGVQFVGFIRTKQKKTKSTIGSISSLNKLIVKFNIHEIYVADPSLSHDKILTFIAKCSRSNVKFKIASNIFDLITGNIDVSNLESIPTLDVGKVHFPLWKRLYKYSFDSVLAISCLILTLPLWLVIAFAIRFDSPGNILITQKRMGIYGKPFYIYKFRTMLLNTPLYSKSPKKRNDLRVTRVGRFLRRHSLDELPQLINILKGEMSFVGPRPEMYFIVKKYNAWEKRRLSVKPGLTGLWQILGRKDLPLTENLEYDFYYINNQSFLLDIIILLKTVPAVLKGKGAY